MNILVFYCLLLNLCTSAFYFHLTAEPFARRLIIKTLDVQLKSIAVTQGNIAALNLNLSLNLP